MTDFDTLFKLKGKMPHTQWQQLYKDQTMEHALGSIVNERKIQEFADIYHEDHEKGSIEELKKIVFNELYELVLTI